MIGKIPPQKSRAVDAFETEKSCPPSLIVAIGVGAGGSKSLKKLLLGLPGGQDTAYILIRHPEPSGKDLTPKELGTLTAMNIVEASDELPVAADQIYIVAPDRLLTIHDGKLSTKSPIHCGGLWMPIDHFFCAVAEDRKGRACGIILSGAGSDGTLGLSEIKAAGGKTIVEDPNTSRHPGMSQSAVNAGVAQSVLHAEAIAEQILALAAHARNETDQRRALAPEPDPGLRAILDILRMKVGHDFRCYKPNTLWRRVQRRMSFARAETLTEYGRFLEENPREIVLLQKDLQIGVTEFFRQPQAWETLEEKVIAALTSRAHPGSAIRVWVPGCSTGQEAYSLAMILTEHIEKTGKNIAIQLFATDSDSSALAVARAGSYSEADIRDSLPPEYLKRFFTRKDSRFQIIKAIREQIVFAPQNVTADPPFSRLDLISCRNLLMYLDHDVQQKILAVFHFALGEGGFLFLGSAESIGDRMDLFEPVSKKWRIYRRIGVGRSLNLEIPVCPLGAAQSAHDAIPSQPSASRTTLASTAQQILMDRFAPASVMVDRKLRVLYVHGAIDEYLTFPDGELSMHVVDMAREGLKVRLRGASGKCIETGRPVSIKARVRRGGKSVAVKVVVSPLHYPRGADGLLLVSFEDERLPTAKADPHVKAAGDIRQLEDELKITREELQSTIEQLEGSNDQLKASNEEVMAANEELQAANEELETSKEELQSLNEELNTINIRLGEKVEELENTNNDVTNLLASTAIATLFLDRTFRIRRFTPALTTLFSLIPSDLGRPIGDIVRHFADENLAADARRVLTDLTPAIREIRADDGRWFIRRITPYRTQDDRIEGVVVTFVDFTDRKRAEDGLNETKRRKAIILDSIADGFFALDPEWRFIHINDPALGHFGRKRDEVMGRGLFEVFPETRNTVYESEYRRAMETGESVRFETTSIIGGKTMEVYAYPGADNLTVLFRDITERHQMAEALRKTHDRAKWLARLPEENPHPMVRASSAGLVLYCNPASAADSSWDCKEGKPLPTVFRTLVADAMMRGKEVHEEIQLGNAFYGVTVTPFSEDGYANIYGRDITKRKQAELALQESEKRVRMKLDSILSPEGNIGNLELGDLLDVDAIRSMMTDFSVLTNIAVAILDIKGNILVGEAWQDICTKFHRVHPEACQHCIESDTQLTRGVPPGESRLYKCKNNMWDIATPIMVGGEHMGNVFSGQFFFEDEPVDYEIFRKQARRYGFDEKSYLDALNNVPRLNRKTIDQAMSFLMKLAQTVAQLSYSNIKLARSITERKTSEEALRSSEERLTRAQKIAHLGSWELDLVQNRLTWSDEVYRIFGLEPQEFGATYEAFLEYVHPADRKAVHSAYSDSIAQRLDFYEIEHRVVRRNTGEVRIVEERCQHFRDASGTIIRSVGMVHDVTERKRAEELLLKKTEQLETLNKELESFNYSVSHDLRSPLRAIDGFSRMILKKHAGLLSGDVQGKLNIIRQNTQMMGQLIDDLLAFSRLNRTQLTKSKLDMCSMIQEIWNELAGSESDRRIDFRMADLPTGQGDPALIRQVLVNILANAVKFTKPVAAATIAVDGQAVNGECVYEVRDNGVGFDMRYYDKMFGVFQRLHHSDEFEGTGVGLAIVQRIVHRHGGRVWARGEVGVGASLFFTLPET